MPAPAVYVIAVVGTVAASVAFYEFVYEPHIAPKIEQWAHNWKARREAKRQGQQQRANPVPVPVKQKEDKSSASKEDVELTELGSSLKWGNRDNNSTLRQRKSTARPIASSLLSPSPLEESNVSLPYLPMTPTHVISDPSDPDPLSPASTIFSKKSLSPSAPQVGLPTPETSPPRSPVGHRMDNSLHSQHTFSSPSLIPSLSLSHPVDLDQEHDVELLSAPSSRAESPFSSVSHSNSELYYSAHGSTLQDHSASDRVSIHSFNSQSSLSLTSFDSELDSEEDASRRSSLSDFSLVSGAGGGGRHGGRN